MAKPVKPGDVKFLKQAAFHLSRDEWKKVRLAAATAGIPMSEWYYRIVKPEIDKLPEPTT